MCLPHFSQTEREFLSQLTRRTPLTAALLGSKTAELPMQPDPAQRGGSGQLIIGDVIDLELAGAGSAGVPIAAPCRPDPFHRCARA